MKVPAGLLVFVATVAGTIGYVRVADLLDRAYRPFSDDMHAWIFIGVPTGAILSGFTASAIASALFGNHRSAIIKCMATGTSLGAFYLWALQDMSSQYGSYLGPKGVDYALAMCGPVLLWCAFLILWALFLGMLQLLNPVEQT